MNENFNGKKRFLSDQPMRTQEFLKGAEEYVNNMSHSEKEWLYKKPYDGVAPDGEFFNGMYQVLNLIKALELPHGGKVLEVGSGPGWVTEILAGLGCDVDAIEPCKEMIDIAKDRVSFFLKKLHVDDAPRVQFFHTTLEDYDSECDQYDAILFHESLHHVIDEERGIAECFKLLKPGGVLGVDEFAWISGDRALEAMLENEMEKFGTLENPFSHEYLEHLLKKYGFIDITRYHMINGFIPVNMGERTVRELANAPAEVTNNLTAVKPGGILSTRSAGSAQTKAEIKVTRSTFNPESGVLFLAVELQNTGETCWLSSTNDSIGTVSLALRHGEPGSPAFVEATPRHRLTEKVMPGKSILMDVEFKLPEDKNLSNFDVDMVNEGLFWFSGRGSSSAHIEVDR